MTENYMVNLVAWIILYASFWLTKHNPVSTAFRRRECHTGFLAKWLEKTIFPFRWYGSRPTYEGFIENLVVFYLENSGHKITLYTKRWFALANHFFLCYNIFRYFSIFGGFLLTLNQYLL